MEGARMPDNVQKTLQNRSFYFFNFDLNNVIK